MDFKPNILPVPVVNMVGKIEREDGRQFRGVLREAVFSSGVSKHRSTASRLVRKSMRLAEGKDLTAASTTSEMECVLVLKGIAILYGWLWRVNQTRLAFSWPWPSRNSVLCGESSWQSCSWCCCVFPS